jgi:ribosomal protein S18 acetylase RimI-like enzyme
VAMEYELRPATSGDRDWLEGLRRAAYLDLFRATWGAWDEARHARHFAECLQRGRISIVEVNDEPVGMVQVFDAPDVLQVGEIQILPTRQSQGIGSQILKDIITSAHRQGKVVRLSVALKNDRAFKLYQHLGFRQVAQSETHNHMVAEP